MSINNAQQLINDANGKLGGTEANTSELKGVKNLSVSDLETLILYAESYIQSGGYGFNGLMEPLGEVGQVLGKYGLK